MNETSLLGLGRPKGCVGNLHLQKNLYLGKLQCKLEDNSVCIPQAGKPKLFQRCQEGKRKVGISLTSAPGPGLTLWDELEE